jgi:hypothetical protein
MIYLTGTRYEHDVNTKLHSLVAESRGGLAKNPATCTRGAGLKSLPDKSLYVLTSNEAHPASYPMGTGGPFPGVKSGLGMTLTTQPNPVPRS